MHSGESRSLMAAESASPQIDEGQGPHRASRRRTGWLRAGILVCAAALAGGLWWNSLRPENCFRRGRRALQTGDRATVFREVRRLLDTPDFEPQGRLLAGL